MLDNSRIMFYYRSFYFSDFTYFQLPFMAIIFNNYFLIMENG